MDQYVNIGSVDIYESDGNGSYEYSMLLRPQDYLSENLSIHIVDNMGFGSSVDIHDDKVIVGCPNESPYDSSGNTVWNNRNIGAVYVFDKNNGDLLQKIIPDNTPGSWTVGSLSGEIIREHRFGYSVAASNHDFIVIGAPGYISNISSTAYQYSGLAYVYKWNTNTLQYDLTFTISPSSKVINNRFGDTVLVDDESVIIANSPKAGTSNPGIIRYVTLNSSRTGSTVDVKLSNTHSSWQYSVAADNGRIAVGLPMLDTVNVYSIIDGIAIQDHTITEDKLSSFEFGYDLAFDEDKILVGCPNGYYKLGVVLRLGQVSGEYTLV